MRTSLPLLTAGFLAALSLSICTQAQQEPAAPPRPADATVLKTGTKLVIADIVVQDRNGNPIQGLKQENFILTEDKKPQVLNSFDEHTTPVLTSQPELPPMAPGEFTNYTAVPPAGPLYVLLMDSLNTQMKDQMYVREQLEEYIKNAVPGTRIAIFGLGNELFMIQGFTSDLGKLKASFDNSLTPRAPMLMDDPMGSGSAGKKSPSSVKQQQTQFRVDYTLQGLNNLARYLSAFPGRKNVVWFSSAFPIDSFDDNNNSIQYTETTNLLGQAQIAIFTIDAKGLAVQPAFSATNTASAAGAGLAQQTAAYSQAEADNILNAEELAEDTGGQTFKGNNNLAGALRRDILAGANFYTVTYSPTNKKADGGFRSIHVELTPELAAMHYMLSYRRGYYADEPPKVVKGQAQDITTSNSSATITPEEMASTTSGQIYARASMAHGAPPPQDIIFKVRVLPASTETEATLAPDNQPDPAKPIKGPYRRYLVDYAALSNAFQLTLQPNGNRTGAVEFSAFLYDSNGKLLNATGETINLNLDAEAYKRVANGVGAHLEISAPAKGESYLRIGVHDIPSNRFGAVEVPVTTISKLTPPPTPPAPAPAATTAPPK